MKNQKFNLGDVVVLKSGGCKMTINRIDHTENKRDKNIYYACCWFDKTTRSLAHGRFHSNALTSNLNE